MKKSAIIIATFLALNSGVATANSELFNGLTGKIETEYTTQDKSARLEGRLGYDFNFGAVSVIPFVSAETQYTSAEDSLSRKGFDNGAMGGGLTIQTNYDNFYAYVEGRAMRKSRIQLTGPIPTPMGFTPAGAEIFLEGTVKEYKAEVGTGYKFDNGLHAGVEAAFTSDRFKGLNLDTKEIYAVVGYEFFDNATIYAKLGRSDTAEPIATPYAGSNDEWETKSVIGLKYEF